MEDDQTKAMKRARTNFQTSLTRMAQDLKEGDKTIGGNINQLSKQYNRAIHGQAVHWQGIMRKDSKSWSPTSGTR